MAHLSYTAWTLLSAALLSPLASAVQTLDIKGANFVTSGSSARLDIIGIDYQPGGQSGFDPTSGIDPLSNGDICLRDATLIQQLGANAIRVYNLDPDLNHDDCASIFNAAGIYMLLDVNSPLPGGSLDRAAPWTTYTSTYINRTFAMVEAFAPYPNTLGFFAGNEVINEQSVPQAPAYVRAVTRDLKDYIAKHANRAIGVGYSAADVRSSLEDSFNYLSCSLSNSTSSKIDFFGLNSYSWCGNSSFTDSGYDVLVDMFANATTPVFFSEYGCNNVKPRVFSEVPVLYGPLMTGLCGGFIYEYSEEASDYGLVTLNDNDTVSLRIDYVNLAKEYDLLNMTLIDSYNATAASQTPPVCEPSLITNTSVADGWDLPARPDGVDDMISNGIQTNNKGKLVSVSNTTPSQTVYGLNGEAMTGLKLKVLANDQSNTPGNSGNSSTSTTSTSSGPKPKATKGAASTTRAGTSVVAIVSGLVALMGYLMI